MQLSLSLSRRAAVAASLLLKSDAEFTFGRPMKGHSWHAWTWAGFVRRFAEHVKQHAPPGEDAVDWNY